MKKIAILIPYFGNWPEWFDVFLETCRHNKPIEWIFFTDCEVPKNRPENTIFEKMSLKSLENMVSKETGVQAEIKRPYKVCDFRPAFGEIFGKYLKDYDFWGWGDIDVVYGDLGNIFTHSNLEKYDFISVRRRRTAGALTILRNEKRINNMYKKSKDFRRIFEGSVGYAFDESGKFKDRSVDSITDVIKRQTKTSNLNALFWDFAKTDRKIEVEDIDMYWKDGKIYRIESGEEVYMYHFIDVGKKNDFTTQDNIDMSRGFLIGRGGIREASSPPSIRRKPLLLARKRVKDGLRWMKDRIEQKWT